MYNDSNLTKAQWEEAERLCQDDLILRELWASYKKIHSGLGKKLVKSYDQYINFVSVAVEAFCMGDEIPETEDLEVLSFGSGLSDTEAIFRANAKKLLASKDDKSADRIKDMLVRAKDLYLDREEVYGRLGQDDKDELASSDVSGSRYMADRLSKKISVNNLENQQGDSNLASG